MNKGKMHKDSEIPVDGELYYINYEDGSNPFGREHYYSTTTGAGYFPCKTPIMFLKIDKNKAKEKFVMLKNNRFIYFLNAKGTKFTKCVCDQHL